VPRLPQPLAVFQPRGRFECTAAAFGGKRRDSGRLVGDVAVVLAVELKEQRGRYGIPVFEYRLIASICASSSSSIRATGHAQLNRRNDGLHRALH
jgi:hypothetical protein